MPFEIGNIRLLAAIMFTDIVGYTAMMEEDEQNAIKLRERHREILERNIDNHQGRILQYYGDGTLSMFGSVIQSARCAISIQQEFNKDPKIPVRIGLHLGDIVYQDDGAYGDGVNVASRIESLAVPGSVLISDKICDEIKNQPDIKCKSLGSYKLKNVNRIYEISALANDGLVVPTREEVVAKVGTAYKSIAVLPFVNMSADPENEYFSDGITEEILNTLSKVKGLQVTSRTSSFAFKGKNMDIREIGKQLNVNTVVEGSVRKIGERVRITAQLINAADGYHIWSESYNRDLEDIFEVQDEISRKIANTLREKLSLSEKQKTIVQSKTENIDAYNLYLKAMYSWNKWTPGDVQNGLKYLKKAIKLDPGWARLYSALSGAYVFLGATGYLSPESTYPLGKKYAQKALDLDDTDYQCHLSMAMVKFFFDWEWDEAERYFHTALDLNPGSAEAHQYYSLYLGVMQREYEAINHAKQAQNLDPLSPLMWHTVGDAYRLVGRFEESIPYYEKALSLNPNFRSASFGLGWSKWDIGLKEEALEIFKEGQFRTGHAFKGITPLGYAYGKLGETEKAKECLRLLEQRAEEEVDSSLEADFAIIYMGLGDYDKAFEYINKAFEQKSSVVLFIRAQHWREIHDDPRYKELMKKLNLD